MNHAIILAGGTGTRMGADTPKQYMLVKGIPVILYSIRKFAAHSGISRIVLVMAPEWKEFLSPFLEKEGCSARIVYADGGRSRQHSVLNGLRALEGIAESDDLVFIHDAARPLFEVQNIDDGILKCREFDAAIPVITVKDATYQSLDGKSLSVILPREQLYSGQSPEAFRFQQYLDAHSRFSDEQIGAIRGSSELAVRAGLSVGLIKGSESNFKITTIEDLRAFELLA